METCYSNRTLAALEERIGVDFRNRDLLLQAVTHRSHLNECPRHPTGHNERPEFLGDAVLELVVTEFLYRKYPEEPEGVLTNWRAAIVNAGSLAEIARNLDLGTAMLMSKGEARDAEDSKSRKYILANAMEALIGAVYLDKGLGASRLFIDACILFRASEIIKSSRDYKSELQELVQDRHGVTPRYDTVLETGPDHAREFTMACVIDGREVARAAGTSKHEAHQAAAKAAIETITHWERFFGRRAERRGLAKRRSGNGEGT